MLGTKFIQLLIGVVLWEVQLIRSESGPHPALKSWKSCRVEECRWLSAGVGSTLPLRTVCLEEFVHFEISSIASFLSHSLHSIKRINE